MLGVFNFLKALNFAIGKGLDLILLNNGDIPVVKIADYNKVLYQQKKKQKENKKNQIVQKIKEIVFKINIAENDFNTKLNHIKEFLADNDKVKITIKMDKRIAESNSQLGFELANKITGILSNNCIIKDQPKKINNLIFMLLEPSKNG